MANLTVRQAAKAVGMSERTLRRWMKFGQLSVKKEQRGLVEVTVVDPAELNRFAGSHGLKLTLPEEGADGQAPAGATGAAQSSQANAGEGRPGTPAHTAAVAVAGAAPRGSEGNGQAQALEGVIAELRKALEDAREREKWLQDRVQLAEQERDRAAEERRRLLDLVPKALPAPRPSWLARTFRGNKGEGQDG